MLSPFILFLIFTQYFCSIDLYLNNNTIILIEDGINECKSKGIENYSKNKEYFDKIAKNIQLWDKKTGKISKIKLLGKIIDLLRKIKIKEKKKDEYKITKLINTIMPLLKGLPPDPYKDRNWDDDDFDEDDRPPLPDEDDRPYFDDDIKKRPNIRYGNNKRGDDPRDINDDKDEEEEKNNSQKRRSFPVAMPIIISIQILVLILFGIYITTQRRKTQKDLEKITRVLNTIKPIDTRIDNFNSNRNIVTTITNINQSIINTAN